MLSTRRIVRTWWPLATSWLLMSAEQPMMAATVARLPDPILHLAAFGGVVWPLALIIESPIIMLLSASTALSRDWASYVKLRRFMMVASAMLTGMHVLIVYSPLYYLVTRQILGVPQEILEPARLGLKIMVPWTWSIAYRRFHQGVLIRFDHSKTVGIGTVIRLSANGTVLLTGYLLGTLPGIIVACSAIICGVISEAIYVGIVVRPVLRHELKLAPASAAPVSLRSFLEFYIPLMLTSLLGLVVQPIGSAALSRMPQAIDSLAVWPVVSGLVFLLRSLGIAYNEVVVALLDEPGSSPSLRRFAWLLTGLTSVGLVVIAGTPLARFWFGTISGLNQELTSLCTVGLWLALPLPGLSVLQSWFQGSILNSRRTRGITEAVVVFLVACTLILVAGVAWNRMPGLIIGMAAFSLAVLAQTAWLAVRSLPARQAFTRRDSVAAQMGKLPVV